MIEVLIVDDDSLTCRAFTTIIDGTDGFHTAACVGSGEEAIDYCRAHEVPLVFMDIALPGMTGVEAAQRISADRPQTAFFIVSVLSSFNVIRKMLGSQIRVRDYLVKPVSMTAIRNLLEAYRADHKQDEAVALKLLRQIDAHDYTQALSTVPEAVRQVFAEQGSAPTDKFLQIADAVLREVSFQDDINAAERFPVSALHADDKTMWAFWLTDVIDEAFRLSMTRKADVLLPVFDYIDAQIKNELNLSSICDAVSVSQSYLSKLFRQYLGVSVMDYIHLRKLAAAKQYMAFTDLSLTQISQEVGYNDGSYFSKVFKKYEGVSPKQFRAMHAH